MTYEEQMDYLAKFHAELEAAIDKGLKRGMEEGREEKAIEDATKLKDAGVALDIISQCTGVPMDILENL